jgi:hypothetical protein
MAGDLLELVPDHPREPPVDVELGEPERIAADVRVVVAVAVQEERGVDPNAVRDAARHRHRLEPVVGVEEAAQRIPDVGDHLHLAGRAGLARVTRLPGREVPRLDEDPLRHLSTPMERRVASCSDTGCGGSEQGVIGTTRRRRPSVSAR